MSRLGSKSLIPTMAIATLLLSSLTVACAPASSPSRSVAPTATLYVFPPTATPEPVTVQTTIPATPELYPSPDGTLIAAQYEFQVNSQSNFDIRLYTLSGQEVGSPYISGASIGSWLGDSSGLVLTPQAGPGAPLLTMDRQGNVRPLGRLATYDLELSPDGRWIGGTALHSDGTAIGAEIVPRGGGSPRTLAPGGSFVGWQNGRAIYVTGGSSTRELYALDPSGGAPLLLAQYPANVASFYGPTSQIIGSDSSSPDGQVLPISSQSTGIKLLVGNRLLPLPPSLNSTVAGPLMWVGPHDILGIGSQADGSQSDYVILDIITGKVIRDTGLDASFPITMVALSRDWMVTSNGDTGPLLELDLVNYITKASYRIDPRLTSITPLGNTGKFACLKATVVGPHPTAGQLLAYMYIIDPALVG